MNDENLKGHGFHERTAREQREIAVMGGKASGEVRRRKANFRKTLNMLLTAEVNTDMAPVLEALGVDSTLESAMLMSMIKAALEGDVKAAYFVAQYAGQSDKPEEDIRNREADTDLKQARKQAVTGENETEEALEKLDEILKGVYENAVKQEAE